MAKRFQLKKLEAFSFNTGSEYSVSDFVPNETWIRVDSRSELVVSISDFTFVRTINEEQGNIRERVYRAISHSTVGKLDTLLYQNSVLHSPPSEIYTKFNTLLESAKREHIEIED